MTGYTPPIAWTIVRNRRRLETAMRGKNLSARELAELSVTSSQTISAIRSGTRRRVRANLAARIEAVLGVERGELFVPSTVPAHESEVDIAEAAS